jgi:hypothetical protein
MKASVVGLVAIVASVVLIACSGRLPCCHPVYFVDCPSNTRVCSTVIPAPAPVAPRALLPAAIPASAKLESR